jgi:uncharacterized membrane protein
MLSVTVLPTILSNLMNVQGDWIFKIVFTIVFSLVPVGLYQLYQIQWDKKIAFAAVILFVATFGFYGSMIAQAKQMIAELFFVLLFLVILKETVAYKRANWPLIMFFVFGLVVSHYSVSYVFIFLILLTAIYVRVFLKNKTAKITSTLVAFSLCLNFLWYTQVVYGPFEKFVSTIQYTFTNFLSEFFQIGSRGESVQLAVGAIESPTLLHNIGRLVYDASIVLILIGFVSMLWKWRKNKRNSEFVTLISLSLGLVLLALIVPRFAGFLEMWRLYHIALMFVAPLFIVGIETIVTAFMNPGRKRTFNVDNEKIKKTYCLALTSIVLISYFAFQTGLVYQVAADPFPSSIALNKNIMMESADFIEESDVSSASWLSNYGNITYMFTYSDTVALLHVLNSYSRIDRRMILLITNTTDKVNYYDTWSHAPFSTFSNNSYIYLRHYNVEKEMTVWNIRENTQYNFTELPILNGTNALISKIYANSASEIYYNVP